jgi:hypothetical protein
MCAKLVGITTFFAREDRTMKRSLKFAVLLAATMLLLPAAALADTDKEIAKLQAEIDALRAKQKYHEALHNLKEAEKYCKEREKCEAKLSHERAKLEQAERDSRKYWSSVGATLPPAAAGSKAPPANSALPPAPPLVAAQLRARMDKIRNSLKHTSNPMEQQALNAQYALYRRLLEHWDGRPL